MLPIATLALVAIYMVFACLLAMVGKVAGITRATPVIWEWLAFAAVMVWLVAHSLVLGSAGSPCGKWREDDGLAS